MAKWDPFNYYYCLVVFLQVSTVHCSFDPSELHVPLLKSNKCLGGRCAVITDHRSADDRDLHEVVQIAGGFDAYLVAASSLGSLLDSGTMKSNLVLIWSSMNDLLAFLAEHKMDTGKGEHYVTARGTSDFMAALKNASTYLRLDSKIFLIIVKNGLLTTHEVYGKSAQPTKDHHYIQQACIWPYTETPCDPMSKIWNRRRDLTGVQILGTYVLLKPNVIIGPDGHTLSGFYPEIFYSIQESLNFTFKSFPSKMLGRKMKNGSFTGAVGLLQHRKVDINIGGQSIRHDRSMVTDISPPLQSMYLVISIKSRDAYELNMWEMLDIFERNAWICFACLAVGLVCAIALIYYTADPLHLHAESLLQAIAFTGSTLILKSYRYTARISSAGRLLCLAIGFLSLVMFAYLRAGLLSKLAIRTRNLHLTDLEDLLDQNIRLILPKGGNIHATFANAPRSTIIGQLWEKNVVPYQTTVSSTQSDKAFDLVAKNHHYAFVRPSVALYTHPHYPCSVTDMGEPLWKVQNTFAYQKDGPLTELFNYHLSRLYANGVIAKMRKRYHEVAPVDCAADTDPQLGYSSVFGLFLILIGGVGLSVTLGIVEAFAAIGKQKKRGRNLPAQHAIPTLVRMTEREQLSGELDRLKTKLREKEELIRKLSERVPHQDIPTII